MLPKSGLPIEDVIPQIVRELRDRTRLVISAPPGAGKTTRVPLALLDEAWLAGRKLILVEPRRIAARAAAERMASTLGEKVSETIGLRSRLDVRTSKDFADRGRHRRRLQPHDPVGSGAGRRGGRHLRRVP